MARPRDIAINPRTGQLVCYRAPADTCIVASIVGASRLTSSHDAELQQATEEIGRVLERVKANNEDRNRELHFVKVPGGLFLAWVEEGVTLEDGEERMERALGMR